MMGLVVMMDGASLQKRRFASAFWRGWAFGFGYFLAGMFWIGNAFLVDAEKFAMIMPLAVTALPAAMGIYWGLAGGVAMLAWRAGATRLMLFGTCIALTEYARSHLFTGLPWNLPAYIWTPGGVWSQLAALIGPYGLTLVTCVLLTAPLCLSSPTARSRRFGQIGCAIGVAIAIYAYGFERLLTAGGVDPMAGKGPIIAAGQAGFSQKEVWDPANSVRVAQTYLNLLDAPEAQKADIVVWPEAAFPFLLLEEPLVLNQIQEKLRHRTLVVGSVRRETANEKSTYFNSLLVFDVESGGLTTRSIYDKFHLVPFGEYLPLRTVFSALGIASLVAYDGEMTPGPAPALLNVPKAHFADPRICYEIIFPLFNMRAKGKARWILNVSIDAWYGDILGPDQHFAQARYRAIETGMPLVRAASGGWSAIVDRFGRTVAQHRSGAGYAIAKLPDYGSLTPYARFGDGLFFVMAFALLSISLWRHNRY
ncbi:apolipoprotein N-acyltransferase [Candidatus Phycosocius spiralis]|uniref:Apolipoprotein N-acyltransferase n=2 Tax=Candidatus Phycosocius spiralis TaxID=2815099 RepID=A0ABQ4PXI8_9PROT|nr:apolipoprotein N-acyltransferase [Candidatus Phycosocius spiralis]